jgi:hypothetical protein
MYVLTAWQKTRLWLACCDSLSTQLSRLRGGKQPHETHEPASHRIGVLFFPPDETNEGPAGPRKADGSFACSSCGVADYRITMVIDNVKVLPYPTGRTHPLP